jgi:hypothetical protein
MPRNRSEKEPTLDCLTPAALEVLKADAKFHASEGHNALHVVESEEGDTLYSALSIPDKASFDNCPYDTRHKFSIEYSRYLIAKTKKYDGT